MVKILVNDGIEADGKLLLEEAGYEVDTTKVPQDQLAKHLPAYDVIIVRSATQVRRDLIDACPNLKIIARGGVGTDNIDVEYARSKGIEIITTPAASSQSVAELAMGHIFVLARFLHRSNREMATGDFKKLKAAYAEGIQIKGKTLGIVGFGRIGQELARMALPTDIEFEGVFTTHQIDVFTRGKADMHFFPQGWAERAIIYLREKNEKSEKGEVFTVEVDPLTGRAYVHPERLRIPAEDLSDPAREEEGDSVF